MRTQLRRWLAPPVFADDEHTRRAALLNVILLAFLAAVLLSVPLVPLGPAGSTLIRAAALATLVVLFLILRVVLRRGRLGLATAGTVAGVLGIMTSAIVWGGGGVSSIGFPGYIILVLVAGLLLGRRQAVAVAVAGVAIGGVLVYGRAAGWVSAPPGADANVEIWLVDSVYFLTAAALLFLALRSLERASARVRQELGERQRAEAALRESEQQFRVLFESVLDPIVLLDDNRFSDCTPSTLRLFGVARADILGHTPAEFSPERQPDGQPSADKFRALAAAALAGQPQSVAWQFQRADGALLDTELSLSAVHVLGQDYVRVILHDVTERQRAEAQLRQMSRAVEQSSAAIVITDRRGAVQYVNPRFTEITGFTAEEALSAAPPARYSAEVPPDVLEQMLASARAGRDWRGEFRNRRKNGELYWESAVVSPVFAPDGAVSNFVGIIDDVTARKQADEALAEAQNFLRLVVDTSPSMIFVLDQHGRLVFVNQYAADYYGVTPEQLLSKSIADVHASGAEARAFEGDDQLVLRTRQRLVKEELNTAPNGEPHWFHTVKVPLVRPDGTVAVLGISTDITERKQHERELQVIATLSAALRSAATIPRMLAVVLEQVRSLLSVAAASVELLDPATGDATVAVAYGPWEAMVGQRLPAGTGLNSHILATGQPYVNNNVLSDPLIVNPALYRGYHAAAGAPMNAQGQLIGFVWIGYTTAIRETDVRLLVAMADIAANAVRRAMLHAQTETRARRLDALHEIDLAITSSLDLNATLRLLAGHVTAQLQVDTAVIRVLNPRTHALTLAAERGPDGRHLAPAILRQGEYQAAQAVLQHRLISLPNLHQAPGPLAEVLLANGLQAYFAAPLLAKGSVVGVLEAYHRVPLAPDPEWLDFLATLARQAAIAIENSALLENLQRSNLELSLAYDATIEGWSRALDLRDHETEGHTQRVAELTVRLAPAMGLDAADLVQVRRGALLHDMGKLAVPDHILLKPAALTAEEWAIMRLHPGYAHQMLAPIDYLRPALDIPYCHHEKWDGSGYPRGLAGEQIPLAARLFAVVDVWDALRSNRPYRPGWTAAAARDYIRAQAGQHFDPAAVDAFLNLDLPD